jgi:hypothetical protein
MSLKRRCQKGPENLRAGATSYQTCADRFSKLAASPKMRIKKWVSIGLGCVFVAGTVGACAPQDGSGTNTGSKVDIDPGKEDKAAAAYLAKQAVPAALKDPSSAEFGDVWGMSSTVACGYVNAKNSFGALAGKTRFIYSSGSVAFENSSGGFPKLWNTACIDKPHAAAPKGAAGMHWGASPTSDMKNILPTTEEGLSLFTPKRSSQPLEGIPIAESDYSFQHRKLYAVDFYIDGDAGRDAVLAALVKKYGSPQQYDESLGTYSWRWPSRIKIKVEYQPPKEATGHSRTTVTYSKDDKQ